MFSILNLMKDLCAAKIGDLSPAPFLEYLSKQKAEIWLDATFRTDLKEFKETRSVLVKGNPRDPFHLAVDGPLPHPEIYRELEPALKFFAARGLHHPVKVILGCLPAQSRIKLHRDPDEYRVLQRFHWVLTTNPRCTAIFRRETFHFAEGEIWSFNNLVLHAAENGGESDRLHVIFDFLNPAC